MTWDLEGASKAVRQSRIWRADSDRGPISRMRPEVGFNSPAINRKALSSRRRWANQADDFAATDFYGDVVDRSDAPERLTRDSPTSGPAAARRLLGDRLHRPTGLQTDR